MATQPWRRYAVLVLLTVGVVLSIILLVWLVTQLTNTRMADAAVVVQAVGTLAAIVIGGLFVYYRLQIFRTFQPHLTITHEVSHRPLGNAYVHIAVTVTAMNSSSVVIAPVEGGVVLQQIAPTSDEAVEHLFRGEEAGEAYDVGWPTLSYISREWAEGGLVIEPGERVSDTYEFAIPKEIATVLAYSFIEDPTFTGESDDCPVWDAQTIYDIMPVQAHSASGAGADNAD